MTRAQLHSFHLRRYTPERMVVAVAGNVDHDEVVGLVREPSARTWCAGRTAVPHRKGTGRVTGQPSWRWSTGTPSRPTCRSGCAAGPALEQRWALSVLNTRSAAA